MREAEFDDQSVRFMLAHLLTEEDRGPHGVLMSRATAKNVAFVADRIPTHDKAQKALAKAKKAYYDANPDADPDGDLWGVREGE